MQKFIAVPIPRYQNLIEKEKSQSGLNQTVDATIKLQEQQELMQRQKHFEYANEKIPENHNVKLGQTAVTALPPPPLHKIREYKKRQSKIAPKLKTKIKSPKKKAAAARLPIHRPIVAKTVQITRPAKAYKLALTKKWKN